MLGHARAVMSRLLTAVACLVICHANAYALSAPELHPAQALIKQADLAVRTDPEASRRAAEQAIEVLKRQPDSDLEIRARLILCDYQSERDTTAAEQQIAAIDTLLSTARRAG